MPRKNRLLLILMCSSIMLLLVLQCLWVRSSWNKAKDDLEKEANSIFRTTIMAMRDSSLQQTLSSLPDSAIRKFLRFRRDDGPGHEDRFFDSTVIMTKPKRKGAGVFILPEDRSDTVHHRRARRNETFEMRNRRDFFFRLAPDSLKIDSIHFQFRKALDHAGLTLPMEVIHARRGFKREHIRNGFVTESVRISPVNRYSAVISDVNGRLIKQTLPQTLFALFLTLLTIVSFVVLYNSIRSQQRLVALKNDFISNMTHELKTPITTVSVAIEALKNFNGLNNPRITEEYLTIAKNELDRLAILTDKVLKTAIHESKAMSYVIEPVDIDALVTKVAASFNMVIEKNGASLNIARRGNNFVLQADHDHLVNVIYNLLDNALKYSIPPATLTIDLAAEPDFIKISVGDNGRGIPVEYRKQIFEKFFRVPTGDVHNIKGYGLGLSYVDSVVKAHHGQIVVKDNAGGGSCFVITLPRKS